MRQTFQKTIRWLLVFNLFLISCSDDSENADKGRLTEKINEAETLLSNTTEGEALGEYEVGAQDELQISVDLAQAVNQDESAIQNLVNSTYDNLCSALDSYRQRANFSLLNSWKLVAEMTGEDLYQLVQADEADVFPIISGKTLDDIKIYKIEYETKNIDGISILVSGSIQYSGDLLDKPLISFQHGTIFTQDDAPSNYDAGELTHVFGSILAASGYAVVMPDYIGYGSSKQAPHPYQHAKSLGWTSFDMLQAAKEFYAANGISLTKQLFLTGYSEGGYATMALHKHIEENSAWEVTMSAPAAGAYNMSGFFEAMMSLDADYSYPGSALWVIDSYNWIYDFNQSWDHFLNEADAATMESITHPFDYIEASLAKNPQDLYTSNYRSGILDQTDTEYLNAIVDNDVHDWSPKYPITLYYGTDDDWVFPINATSAYEAIKSNGGTIDLVAYEGEDHFTSGEIYVRDVFTLFESLR